MVRRALFLPLPAAAALVLSGCAPSATSGGFDSPNPASRLYAIEQAARAGDRAAIGDIVEELDSADPAVRLLAILSLERLTGETFGYTHYDPQWKRNESVERWVSAVNAGQFDVSPAAVSGAQR